MSYSLCFRTELSALLNLAQRSLLFNLYFRFRLHDLADISFIHFYYQIQQGGDPSKAKYAGPLDCAKQIYKEAGLFRGIYKGTCATLLRGELF